MNIFITADKQYYRRWINIIPSWLIPGAGQYFSGRRNTGLALWFLNFIAVLALGWLILSPHTSYSLYSMGYYYPAILILHLIIIGDSLRRPIPNQGIKGCLKFASIYSLYLAAILVPFLLARQFLYQPFNIPSNGMAPTLLGAKRDASGKRLDQGDCFFINKYTYRSNNPKRGDIVVFKTDGIVNLQKSTIYVERVVGVPGDTVSIDPPYVIVNGQKLLDPPIVAKMSEGKNCYSGYLLPRSSPNDAVLLGTSADSIHLETDQYLAFGDNSNNSRDGRYWGTIPRKNIIGKAVYIYAPANRKGWVE